jgi:endonuclease/exonuclease/phosphatase family metal-dependent hydrolase
LERTVPPFPKPKFPYTVDVARERRALRRHRAARGIPASSPETLLVATWNIANLGVQDRGPQHYALLAEIIGWFDLIALQEVNDDLTGLERLRAELPKRYRVLFSEAGGNRERQAFVWDQRKVRLLDKVGRLSIPPADLAKIASPGITEPFRGFDRGPYLAAFQAGDFIPLLINVHLFFGDDTPPGIARRILETTAVAWWAERRVKSRNAYTTDILPLGDFNLPSLADDDPVLRALRRRGLELPRHLSVVGGSSLGGRNHYDQIAFFPGETKEFAQRSGVFDFDNVVFRDLWQTHEAKQFLAYTRYYLSDHRPFWAQFTTTRASA